MKSHSEGKTSFVVGEIPMGIDKSRSHFEIRKKWKLER